ncbi:Sn1-specific diacylglycerol lipase [Actinidia chinensis var. chinensis]|uniref:Sn1-specific diacylglycerol lipase n=1 Tax=Actinidia chinensis var. chinensis TaxID=1590841 RepID=A0A2R6R8V7_ACTCC|nr:Sn1-specific diacylglycerol lipase [Actinidia chinensis var. chinensis]
MGMWVSMMKNLRWCSVLMGVSNAVVIVLGSILMGLVYPSCGHKDIAPFAVILLGSCIRIGVMIRTAVAQQATARIILSSPWESADLEAVIRRERRIRYKRWLWWTRFLVLTTVQQFVATVYLFLIVAEHMNQHGSRNCVLGHVSNSTKWQQNILILFIVIVFFVAIVQCFTGSDVLRWRSFYATEDNAWKTHYREVFDHGIREVLCCLGRFKYLSDLEEDEIYSVAQILGDLVAYRAAGTGHLELLAGLALLQRPSESPKLHEECLEAPEDRIQEAAIFHPFAEAAYTGLLLDIGRNPVLFPCAWLYRQGILTPWTRNRCPVLEGDNWWRGHAAAFLRYVNLSAEALRQGRVNQGKCEAAYFIVVLHHLKSVVIAVRGTETPEDLITDGLCRECTLSMEDLDGLINSNRIHQDVRQKVISSLPHYGHSGIVEAARDLFMQIEGNLGDDDICSESRGYLSSLLGAGCECDGYAVRVVGHSLGGAVAAMLGLRLYCRYPNLHVYAYGPLPCMDPIVADACSEFVTSIVYSNEFSARLSVASVLRLRAAALTALSQDPTDASIPSKLARRFLFVSKYEKSEVEEKIEAPNLNSSVIITENRSRQNDQEYSIWQGTDMQDSSYDGINHNDSLDDFTNPFYASPDNINLSGDPVSEFMEVVPSPENGSARDLPEMFLPGLVIHIVPHKKSIRTVPPKSWLSQGSSYKAYIANRESFKDLIVSSSMFLDHLPWRCDYAMRQVLKSRRAQSTDTGSQMV